jgi:hypothetical protein
MNTIPIEDREPAIVTACASEIRLAPVRWIWPGRIARGKHTAIGGDPGGGKSTLAAFIAATISSGGEWPCGEGRSPRGSVLILSAEDGPGDTIVPRLIAAGADLRRCHIVTATRVDHGKVRGFDLAADLDLLAARIGDIGDALAVVVDPISSYLGSVDSHKNAEVRSVLEPLSAMAERTGVAVISITHFSKPGASGAKALHRFIGSIAFVGAPRIAFCVIEDAEQEGRKLFLHTKNNLAPPPQGLAFGLRQTIVGEGIVTSRIAWDSEPVRTTANEALAADTSSAIRPCAEAEAFLRDLLADGPVPARRVKAEALDAGLAWATVRRAKDRLGVNARKGGMGGGWFWELPRPPKMLNSPEDAHPKKVSTFGQSEHLRDLGRRLNGGARRPPAEPKRSACPRCDGEGCSWCSPR